MSNRRLVSVAAVSTSGTAYTGRANGIFSTNDQAKLKQAGNWPIAIAAPNAPTIGTATVGNSQVTISFTAPNTLNGSTITGYTVTSSGGQTATGSSSPIIVTGLNNGGFTYTFTVVANSNCGNSIASSTVSATMLDVPGTPTIGAVSVVSGTSATVEYTAPSSNGGSAITSYTATSSPGNITGMLSQSSSGTITVNGLTPGTRYTFRVIATSAIGNSTVSSVSSGIVPLSIGDAYQGGYFAGIYTNPYDSQKYRMIVSPKASGWVNGARGDLQTTVNGTVTNGGIWAVEWGAENVPSSITWQTWHWYVGAMNTNFWYNSGYTILPARFAKQSNIGGYNDWFVASVAEFLFVRSQVAWWGLPSGENFTSSSGVASNDSGVGTSQHWTSSKNGFYIPHIRFDTTAPDYATYGFGGNTSDTRLFRRELVS